MAERNVSTRRASLDPGTSAAGDPQGSSGLDDQRLMARICQGDVPAFEALFDRYCDLVYSISLYIVRDAALAEEVVQDVFLRLWRRPDQYDAAHGRFLPWLLSVARNRAIDERRRQGRRLRHEEAAGSHRQLALPTDDAGDPVLAALLSEDRATVRRALQQLPEEQRRTIELAYFGGFTQREIAQALRQPLGTVKTRIRLGMHKLRAALSDGR